MLTTFLLVPYVAQAAQTYGPYNAEVVRIIDGDTVELRVAIWPNLAQQISLRLDGVNTPEKRRAPACEKALAKKATEFTRQFIGDAETIRLYDVRLGKYAGRALGRIEVIGKGFLGPALIAAGHAREYHGGARHPWCE